MEGFMAHLMMDSENKAARPLTLADLSERMLLSETLVAHSTMLAISCHWRESFYAYLTLSDQGSGAYADFAIMRVFRCDSSAAYYLLLGLPPREAGDCERPPLYLVQVASKNQVRVLDLPEISSLLPLPALDDRELCDLGLLSAVLGALPTWDELKQGL
jgi:hypothetical protein